METYQFKKKGKESKKIGEIIRNDYFQGIFEEGLLENDFSKEDIKIYSHKGKKYVVTKLDHFNGHHSNFTDPASIFEIYVREVVEVVEYLGIQVKKTTSGAIYPTSTYVYMPYQIGKWNGDGYSYGDEWYNDMKDEDEDEDWFEPTQPTCDIIDGVDEVWNVSQEDFEKLSK